MTYAKNGPSTSTAAQRKATGAHYTPQDLAAFLASQIVGALHLDDKPKSIRILDPAVGDGELLNALLSELPASVLRRAIVDGFDTDSVALSAAIERLSRTFPAVSFSLSNADFLAVGEKH